MTGVDIKRHVGGEELVVSSFRLLHAGLMIPEANIRSEWWLPIYMENLRQLNAKETARWGNPTTAADENSNPTAAWERYLQIHLDQEFTRNGLQQGVQTRFDYACKSFHKNIRSASKNREVAEKFLQSKQAAAYIVPVLEPKTIKSLHTSPFGVIPKTCQPGQPQK